METNGGLLLGVLEVLLGEADECVDVDVDVDVNDFYGNELVWLVLV
jgi:hypothetical protein